MLPFFFFEHAWHRAGHCVRAQKMFAECMITLKKLLVKAKRKKKHLSKQNVQKIAQVMTWTGLKQKFSSV